MRLGTRLFAALVLAGALADAAGAQPPRPSTAYGPYSTRPSTGTYSVYGPYTERYPSAPGPAPTSTGPDASLRAAKLVPQIGNGRGLGGDAARPDAGRSLAPSSGPGVGRPRYVRIGIAGNAIQAVVIP